MILIYIPFSDEVDYLEDAKTWQEVHSPHEEVILFKEGCAMPNLDDYNEITVYLLAHGIIENNSIFSVVSHSSEYKCALSIPEVAALFSKNFLLYQHKISSLHLFFCNIKGSEDKVTKQFNASLTLFEDLDIKFYGGLIFIPNRTSPIPVTIKDGAFIPISNIEKNFNRGLSFNLPPIEPVKPKSSIKKNKIPSINWRESKREERRQQYFSHTKEKRTLKYLLNRTKASTHKIFWQTNLEESTPSKNTTHENTPSNDLVQKP